MMNNKLVYKKPASCFEEALPIGNGSFGAMVYGGVCEDRLSLNHDTLWSSKRYKNTEFGLMIYSGKCIYTKIYVAILSLHGNLSLRLTADDIGTQKL